MDRGSAQGSKSDTDELANIRHQLRTPINHIIGYGEMLEEEASASGQHGYVADLKKIQDAAKVLLGLIETQFTDLKIKTSVSGFQSDSVASATRTPRDKQAVKSRELSGHVLVVDDVEDNREILARRLKRRGLEVSMANNGRHALEVMTNHDFDVVLLDVMMPELDGYSTLLQMKDDHRTRHIPVIMISALDEIDSVTRCIEAGAEDYLPKPFNPTLLGARLSASLEKKALRDAEQSYLQQIEATQKRLHRELNDAANYVRDLFPEPISNDRGISTAWLAVPCSELAGDAFGYHWIDDDHFAIYLLDVCGHGVRPCLLAASVLNVIRSGATGADMLDPTAVLSALNALFPMDRQNNLYFTMWYGVYSRQTNELKYASAGHPDSILLSRNDSGLVDIKCMTSTGGVVGAFDDTEFDTETVIVNPGASLLVFSDGCFEVDNREGVMLKISDIETFFKDETHGRKTPEDWYNAVRAQRDEPTMDDDFTMLRVDFQALK